MPLLHLLVIPGSARRFLCRNSNFSLSLRRNHLPSRSRTYTISATSHHPPPPTCRVRPLQPRPALTTTTCFPWPVAPSLRLLRCNSQKSFLEYEYDPHLAMLFQSNDDVGQACGAETHRVSRAAPQISNIARKRKMKSLLERILHSAQDDVRRIYDIPSLQHDGESSRSDEADAHKDSTEDDVRQPDSIPPPQLDTLSLSTGFGIHKSSLPDSTEHALRLSTLLGRRVCATQSDPSSELTPRETFLLTSHGYSAEDLSRWISSVQEPSSAKAAAIFQAGYPTPPLFLLLLFLRRKRIRPVALGIIMRHLTTRRERASIPWKSLKITIVRLVRHSRTDWPESMPWIASFFSIEAARILNGDRRDQAKFIQDLSRFCNTLLWLISLPSPIHPFRNSTYQEKAQFRVLQFMQDCHPSLVVTRKGFRAVIRNQLMHPKTAREREWALLKGPSWPPWKEARNAMDEDKGYDFGTSRASRVMRQMHEAGYDARMWEQVAQVYAGWDTDLSPTIQTRTTLPFSPSRSQHDRDTQTRLWVARIQATRSRREAWACFLAWEASKLPIAADPYAAMFAKLYFPEVETSNSSSESEGGFGKRRLLPGDLKEAFPDPESPLHLIHVNEPVPTYNQLFDRMVERNVRMSRRLLSFLVQTHPDFPSVIRLLQSHGHLFGRGMREFFTGELLSENVECSFPDYFFGALLSFLCRFGRLSRLPSTTPLRVVPDDHVLRFETDRHYMLEYAYALLVHVRPRFRPAWTAFMKAIVFQWSPTKDSGNWKASHAGLQYAIITNLFETMEAVDLDPDDEQFRIICTCVRFAAQAARNPGQLSTDEAHHILSTAPRLLRGVFHTLVAANLDPVDYTHAASDIPPHVPDPAVLHAYVRALGMLCDYEGLYSFSTWATTNHTAVTARANTQRSGLQALFRTFVALRAALEGSLDDKRNTAPPDLVELVKAQLQSVQAWGWPPKKHVELYVRNSFNGVRADWAVGRKH